MVVGCSSWVVVMMMAGYFRVCCQLIGRVICGARSGYFMREDKRGMSGGNLKGRKKREKKKEMHKLVIGAN